jgi:hypothetical protein
MNILKIRTTTLQKIIFGLLFFIQLSASAAVWKNEYKWNELWEVAYSKWVTAHWKKDIYTNPNSILYNIPTDCADASYNMRALFAYTYKLPFRAGKITNETKYFDRITNETERFREFIKKVNVDVNTSTLSEDTYPIGLNKRQFRAGIIFVVLKPTNHTVQVVSISPTGIPTILDSTEPSKIRNLFERYSFAPHTTNTIQEGYRAFKWPEHYLQSNSKNGDASLEQFELFNKVKYLDLYFNEIESRLRERQETVNEKTNRLLKLICNETRFRIENVEFALDYLSKKPANYCFSKYEYSDYSTPNRDAKMVLLYKYALNIYNDPYFKKEMSADNQNKIISLFESQRNQDWCPLKLKSNLQVSLSDVWKGLYENKLVSDPNANEKQRWGFEDFQPLCPQY